MIEQWQCVGIKKKHCLWCSCVNKQSTATVLNINSVQKEGLTSMPPQTSCW